MVRIDDLDRVIDLDVGRRDDALALLAERERGLVVAVHADGDVLEVQQNLDDVFLQAFERGVLVQHAVDFDLDDRAARNGRQQHAPQRVAERMAEAALERLDHDLGAVGADTLDVDAARTQHVGGRSRHMTLTPRAPRGLYMVFSPRKSSRGGGFTSSRAR